MASQTTNLALRKPDLGDPPNVAQDISNLADDVDGTVGRVPIIGVPSGATTSLGGSAWTDVCSCVITLASAGLVEITAWARLVNTGAGRAMVALQVLNGSTHLYGSGQKHIGGTSDQFGDEEFITLPRRRFALSAGTHTIKLQAYKDANGSVDVKKTDTYQSQAIATTGIEVS